MARQRYRGNTLAASFPLLSSFTGQTIIVRGIDQFHSRGAAVTQDTQVPEVVFMENVMPMANGLQSVGFYQAVVPSRYYVFDQAFYLRDRDEKKTLYVPANGYNLSYNFVNFRWDFQYIPVPFGAFVSVAYLKQRQFVSYARNFVLEWDGAYLSKVTLKGLDPTQIIGIVEANAYLVAYSENKIFWSSIIDPVDFVPSNESLAGSTDVLALKGKIVVCVPIGDGYLIYTTENVIAAQYTANSRFPWTFKEISGSKGVDDPEKVCRDCTDITQYAMTVSGMMALDRAKAQQILPEVSEFLAGRRYESFNFLTKKIQEFDVNDLLISKISLIGSRYLVISYGDNRLTHAIILDLTLKRWGKIKIDHVDCFEFVDKTTLTFLGPGVRYKELIGTYEDQTKQYIQYGHLTFGPPVRYIDLVGSYEEQYKTYLGFGGIPVPGVFENLGMEPYKNIAFLQQTGAVYVVNFNLPDIEVESVLLLGKYQLQRGRLASLQEVFLENVSAEKTSKLALLKSFDGFNNVSHQYMYKDKERSKGRLQMYLHDGSPFMNCTLQLEGNFDLSSIEIVFTPAGYR